MAKMTIIEGNSNDKDNVRAYMVKGERGDDGISPTFETSKTGDTATITITDAEGTHEVELKDGFSPTVTASKTNKVTTVTITDIGGTETTTINDGVDLTGGVPTNGVIAFDGVQADIPDGYEVSPTSFATLTNSYSTSTSEGYTANYINSLIPTFETGYVASSQMTNQNIGGHTGKIYDLTFTKTYSTAPTVVATARHDRGLTSYGLIQVGVRGITTTGCSLLFDNDMSDTNYGVNYLVISND